MSPLHLPSRPVLLGLGTVIAVLIVGSSFALFHPKLQGPAKRNTRMAILSWWPITLFWTAPCAFGPAVALVATALVSLAALREYLQMLPAEDRHPLLDGLAYAAVPLHYAALTLDARLLFGVLLAWGAGVMPVARMAVRGPRGFLGASSRVLFGLVVCVLALSHIYLVFRLPAASGPAGAEGIAAFLILIVLMNDATQWSAGKVLGRTKIAPELSPNKTWEGLLGGVAFNAALGVPMAKLFLPVSALAGAGIAAGLSVTGFVGDIYVSAIKRDLGVKDTGAAIPGQGGVLDRHDSMVLNAPIYAWAAHALLAP